MNVKMRMSLDNILADITFMENIIKAECDVATQDGNLHLWTSLHDSFTNIESKVPFDKKICIFHSDLVVSVTVMCGPKFCSRTFLYQYSPKNCIVKSIRANFQTHCML
jgi:hypothetical protein